MIKARSPSSTTGCADWLLESIVFKFNIRQLTESRLLVSPLASSSELLSGLVEQQVLRVLKHLFRLYRVNEIWNYVIDGP